MKIKLVIEKYENSIVNLPFFVFRKINLKQKGKLAKIIFLVKAYAITLFFKLFHKNTLCFFMNIFYKFDGKIHWDKEKEVYLKITQDKKIYFPNKYRISGSMVNHKFELDNLLDSYCLNNFELNEGDVVVDCGANIGSFHLALSRYIKNFSYFGYEPDPYAYNCLELNLQNSKNTTIVQKALSNKTSKSELYVEPNYGDSSLEKFNSNEKVDVDLISLDDEEFKSIKLLKIDAEGHELGVLQGASKTLKKIEYICVDMGSEKGVYNENTLPEVTNFLLDNDFTIIYFNDVRNTALFNNILFKSK